VAAARPDADSLFPRLPLLPTGRSRPRGSRQLLTCRYRCGDACAHGASNSTDNPTFRDVLQRAVSRRSVLRVGAVLSATAGGLALSGGTAAAHCPDCADYSGGPLFHTDGVRGLRFDPVAPNTADALTIPDGYTSNVVIRWGDPVVPGAPEFDFDNQTAEAQAMQFGYNCDFTGLVDLERDMWLMTCNHEYTTEPLMFRGYDPENPTEEQVRIALAAHGMSVVVIKREPDGRITAPPNHTYNRRITATSEIMFAGPATGSDYLKTSADPTGTVVLGTLNNCAGGVTPWGTILSGEENFNQYFANGADVADPALKERLARYGLDSGPSDRRWEDYEPRFDIVQEPNETHRFGWVVELDPADSDAPVVKHTALGRLKHEGATIRVAPDGRVVAYMGDDEVFEYVYKFVSDECMLRGSSRRAREHNRKLLDSGTLYVARFDGDSPTAQIDGSDALPADGEFDGTGEWIPLAHNDRSFVDGMTADEVYVFTRIAGDAVGATKMDRPEDVEPNPWSGRVYMAMTNNDERGVADGAPVDEANPRVDNKHGQVVELTEDDNDPLATRFAWRLFLVCGDPEDPSTYFAGFDKSQVSPISCPDNLRSTATATCGSPPTGTRWSSTTGCTGSRSSGSNAGTRSCSAPCRSARRRADR
jgi:secreted PhoX family phosphatase